MRDKLGLPDPAKGETLLVASASSSTPAAGPDGKPTAASALAGLFARSGLTAGGQAAPPPRDAVDLLVDATDALSGDAMDAMIGRVHELVAGATSLEQVRDGLLGLSPQMPVADLAAVMRQALVIAELSGRSEIASPFTSAPPGASDG